MHMLWQNCHVNLSSYLLIDTFQFQIELKTNWKIDKSSCYITQGLISTNHLHTILVYNIYLIDTFQIQVEHVEK